MTWQKQGVRCLEKNRKYYVAITGASGSGKTTVLQIIKEMDFFVKDYDEFSVEVIRKSEKVGSKLQEIIGIDFLPNGQADLKRIGDYFDEHFEEEQRFEIWYQPYLGKQIQNDILQNDYRGICFFDVPFLKEKEIGNLFDEIWVIKTDFGVCCKRVQMRNGYSLEKAQYLVGRSSVVPEGDFVNVCFINNNFSKDELERQIINIVQLMKGVC